MSVITLPSTITSSEERLVDPPAAASRSRHRLGGGRRPHAAPVLAHPAADRGRRPHLGDVPAHLPLRVRRRHRHRARRRTPTSSSRPWPSPRGCSPAARSAWPTTSRAACSTGCVRCRCHGRPPCSVARWPTRCSSPGARSSRSPSGSPPASASTAARVDAVAAIGLCVLLRRRVHVAVHLHGPRVRLVAGGAGHVVHGLPVRVRVERLRAGRLDAGLAPAGGRAPAGHRDGRRRPVARAGRRRRRPSSATAPRGSWCGRWPGWR